MRLNRPRRPSSEAFVADGRHGNRDLALADDVAAQSGRNGGRPQAEGKRLEGREEGLRRQHHRVRGHRVHLPGGLSAARDLARRAAVGEGGLRHARLALERRADLGAERTPVAVVADLELPGPEIHRVGKPPRAAERPSVRCGPHLRPLEAELASGHKHDEPDGGRLRLLGLAFGGRPRGRRDESGQRQGSPDHPGRTPLPPG